MSGKFITFEGCEGSGKTTQCQLLLNYCKSLGLPVIVTKEPGGTELANRIRNILLCESEIKDAMTEFLLLSAARRDHVINYIKPYLLQGYIVICDRFFDSSIVYQGYCKGLDLNLIHTINSYASDFITPDITFLLDLEPLIAKERIGNRDVFANHYDNKDLGFYQKVRDGFITLSQNNQQRIKLIDASCSQELVFQKIKDELSRI